MQPRLRQHYESKVVQKLADTFEFGNPMEIPRIEKIVINVGLGDAKDDPKLLDSVVKEVALVAGQRPVESSQAVWKPPSLSGLRIEIASATLRSRQPSTVSCSGRPSRTT
jgi:hypothetical protein